MPRLRIDGPLNLKNITPDLVDGLNLMAPFGLDPRDGTFWQRGIEASVVMIAAMAFGMVEFAGVRDAETWRIHVVGAPGPGRPARNDSSASVILS